MFYGVGVTIGAGIFALIGEVMAVAGDHAVWAFVLAGLVAGCTGFSYVLLAGAFPRAAGEAVFVKNGLGAFAGRVVGYAVVAVAITSSAVIALAFARYLSSFTGLPEPVGLVAAIAILSLIAMVGVRESVAFAAIITLLEVGTLLILILVGLPVAMQGPDSLARLAPPEWSMWPAVASGAFIAFFAFIGFEDIENMAEETREPEKTVPRAIILTLVISVAIYAAVAWVAASFPNREALVQSKAPLAAIFEQATGRSGEVIAAMATIAMVNGILVQMVMASRVLYGMSKEQLVPGWFGKLHATRQTPVRATFVVGIAILLLALFFPIISLAEATSAIMLLIFAAVNISLVKIGRQPDAAPKLRRWWWWGLPGAAIALALVAAQLITRN